MLESTKYINFKNRNIFLRVFLPENPIRAIVQINHGLAEHGGRYREFAMHLCQQGFGVYIHDHPGHGKSIGQDPLQAGHLPWKTGWNLMLNCINQVNKIIRKDYPQTPVFLMGHSMGSLLSRQYNTTYPMYFNGMILSGTTHPSIWKLYLNLLVTRLLSLFIPSSQKLLWLNNKFYNSYNKRNKNPETQFDWLCSDPVQVEKYIADPLCGMNLSISFFKNLLQGSLRMRIAERNLKLRKSFSTCIISGKNDPVGNFGKDPERLYVNYSKQGYINTKLVLLDGKHELLNESNKEKTFKIISDWIMDHLPQK